MRAHAILLTSPMPRDVSVNVLDRSKSLHAQQDPAAEEQAEEGPENATDEASEGGDEEAEEEEPKPEITVSSFHASLGSAGYLIIHCMHGIFCSSLATQTE